MPKRKHNYFPCINLPEVIEEEQLEAEEIKGAVVMVPKTPEYTFNVHFDHASEFAPGEKRSPLLSPFSAVRVSNYSSEDENDGGNVQVDDEAEEFIRRAKQPLMRQHKSNISSPPRARLIGPSWVDLLVFAKVVRKVKIMDMVVASGFWKELGHGW
ncbi:unnamed protein product [Dovyalis caffra]|uniref:Uncharacterized protein n=1 Tax=Dovyalis caffra TaxID=77055 RepID=A0AAV1SA08_9ROSI|nr:unnamed protein product [Dovyalis caffra]